MKKEKCLTKEDVRHIIWDFIFGILSFVVVVSCLTICVSGIYNSIKRDAYNTGYKAGSDKMSKSCEDILESYRNSFYKINGDNI